MEPGPGPILTPVEERVLLTCSVTPPYYVEWQIKLPGYDYWLTTNKRGIQDALEEKRGITAEGTRTARSTLAVGSNEDFINNGTLVRCLAFNLRNLSQVIAGQIVELIFDGKQDLHSLLHLTSNT